MTVTYTADLLEKDLASLPFRFQEGVGHRVLPVLWWAIGLPRVGPFPHMPVNLAHVVNWVEELIQEFKAP